MEIKNNIQLKDETVFPDEEMLRKVLGRSYKAFCKLLKMYDNNEMVYEWRYYKDGKAWLLKVQKKQRTIVWMSAWRGYMKATIYFPQKYIDDIYNLNISEETKENIRKTKKIGKSQPCTFEIRNQKILKDFNEVMQFKLIVK